MKKHISLITLVIMILSLFSGCKTTANNASNKFTAKPISIESELYNISIDPKTELLQIVQYLAGDEVILKGHTYDDDIDKWFSKYKNHEVIKTYKEMYSSGYSYQIPPESMIFVDENLNLKKDVHITDEVLKRSGGINGLENFLSLLKDFRIESNFDEFYKNKTSYYKYLVSDVQKQIDKYNDIKQLVDYYGYSQNSFNVVILPLTNAGFGVRVPAENSRYDVYDFMGIPYTPEDCSIMLLHEFGHSYVNPLTEKYIDKVNEYKILFEPIKEDMTRMAYPAWKYCVNEHISSAVSYRILASSIGEDKVNEYMKYRESKFIYIEPLYNKLKEYENNRDKYKTFDEFYPELLNVFKELSEK